MLLMVKYKIQYTLQNDTYDVEYQQIEELTVFTVSTAAGIFIHRK